MAYLGLDIGTSSVKAVLIDDEQRVLGSETSPLEVQRPHAGWSEQGPESWWTATGKARAAVAAIVRATPAITRRRRVLRLTLSVGRTAGASF